MEKEIVREDARVLKKNWRKSIVEHKSPPGEADMGFDDLCSTIDFSSIFLTPAHPHTQSLFLFPIVFGINSFNEPTFLTLIIVHPLCELSRTKKKGKAL